MQKEHKKFTGKLDWIKELPKKPLCELNDKNLNVDFATIWFWQQVLFVCD